VAVWPSHLATALAALEAGECGTKSAADILALTTSTHGDRLNGHLFGGARLLGRNRDLHLLSLRLGGFLGRHIDLSCSRKLDLKR